MMEPQDFWVRVRCDTYNQVSFIKDTLDGFSIQETNFPFICTIFDDASTDGEPDVLMNYLQQHFDVEDKSIARKEETEDYVLIFARNKKNKNCFFAVFFLKYNHYSIKKDKFPYSKERNNTKYTALCEGDDYWIDPCKLQKQVDFMELNPSCTMVCNRTGLLSVKKNRIAGESYCYSISKKVQTEDAICRGGLFISTCSIMFRHSLKDTYPQYCKDCLIGDFPLQIYSAIKGFIYYDNDIMSVYRVDNSASWMGSLMKVPINRLVNRVLSEVNMLNGFITDYPQFKKYLEKRKNICIITNVPNWRYTINEQNQYLAAFQDEIRNFSRLEIFDLNISKIRVRGISRLNQFRYQRKYGEKVNIKRLLGLYFC